jgi:hypothetical protein
VAATRPSRSTAAALARAAVALGKADEDHSARTCAASAARSRAQASRTPGAAAGLPAGSRRRELGRATSAAPPARPRPRPGSLRAIAFEVADRLIELGDRDVQKMVARARRLRTCCADLARQSLLTALSTTLRALSPRPRFALRDDPRSHDPARCVERAAARQPLPPHFPPALHESGCAAAATGWTPRYVTARDGDALAGACRLRQAHSYGEYVFDWAWAEAYRRHQRRHIRSSSRRPVHADDRRAAASRPTPRCARRALDRARHARAARSSLHVLFPTEAEAGCRVAGPDDPPRRPVPLDESRLRVTGDFLAAFNTTSARR